MEDSYSCSPFSRERIELGNIVAPLQFSALYIESRGRCTENERSFRAGFAKTNAVVRWALFFIRKRKLSIERAATETISFPAVTTTMKALTDKLRSQSFTRYADEMAIKLIHHSDYLVTWQNAVRAYKIPINPLLQRKVWNPVLFQWIISYSSSLIAVFFYATILQIFIHFIYLYYFIFSDSYY